MGQGGTRGAPRVEVARQVVIHLDTSFLIRALVRDTYEDGAVRQWVRDGARLAVSSIAWTQLLCGPISDEGARTLAMLLDEPVPFGVADAALAARLFNETGRRRGSLADCMIAATAIQADAPLATGDVTDFGRFKPLGLTLVER